MHIILGFEPISKRFQSSKNVIKAKDPWLALIDVAVPGILLTDPPPVRTQDTQLPASLVTRLLYSQELPTPSDDEAKEPTPELVQEVTNKDFEVFYQQKDLEDLPGPSLCHLPPAQVSTSQKEANIPEGMVLEEKTLDLLALLTAHAGGASQAIPVVPRPTTSAPTQASSSDTADKKRKKGQGGKGSKDVEEGEVTCRSKQPPSKEPPKTRAQQKKSVPSGTSKGSEGEQQLKAFA